MNVNINDLVSYDSTDHIATITINRPERMNALNEEIIVGLQQAWQHFNKVMTELRFCTPQAIAPFLLVRTLKRRHRKWARRPKHWRNHQQTHHRGGTRLVYWRGLRDRTDVRHGDCCRQHQIQIPRGPAWLHRRFDQQCGSALSRIK